ncbi:MULTISPECIES: hypothetical protein [Acetobacter]|nr:MULTISPECIES: hypothetical protein [Acetobacter]
MPVSASGWQGYGALRMRGLCKLQWLLVSQNTARWPWVAPA